MKWMFVAMDTNLQYRSARVGASNMLVEAGVETKTWEVQHMSKDYVDILMVLDPPLVPTWSNPRSRA